MPHWSDYGTGERIKILRGRDIRQSDLAEMTGLSLPTIQHAEQDRRLTLQTLMKIAASLGVDTSAVLGQQALRRTVQRDDRTIMRALSQAVHDSAAGLLPDTVATPAMETLTRSVAQCWDQYWRGGCVAAGALAGPLITEASARLREQPVGEQGEAWGLLADAYRLGWIRGESDGVQGPGVCGDRTCADRRGSRRGRSPPGARHVRTVMGLPS